GVWKAPCGPPGLSPGRSSPVQFIHPGPPVEGSQETEKMRVEAARISRRQLVTSPPGDGLELAGVRAQVLVAGAGQNVPEADVRVAMVLPDRTRDGHKDRRPRQTRSTQTKLFPDLAPRGARGVLIDLDVTTRRQPQPGVDVVDEQD